LKLTAVCIRCGNGKPGYSSICPSCGHRPEGEGLLVAWLFSAEHIDEAALQGVAKRIKDGQDIRPSDKMLDKARRALGTHFSSDPGMTGQQRVALLLTSLFLTPLVGLVICGWLRNERPRVAIQALGLSLPASVLFFCLVVGLLLR